MRAPGAESPTPALNVKLLLFDLGGVLIDFSGPRELGQYLSYRSTPEEILQRWVDCPHTTAFERGHISARDWADRFVRDWSITLEPQEFLTVFRGMARSVLPGARELLAELRPRFRLAALSNSNEIHWERNFKELRFLELFEFAVSSHQVGLCKPDPAIFQVVLDRAQLPPAAVMFFDDLPANVTAARSLGMHGRRVKGVDGIRASLIADGLIGAT